MTQTQTPHTATNIPLLPGSAERMLDYLKTLAPVREDERGTVVAAKVGEIAKAIGIHPVTASRSMTLLLQTGRVEVVGLDMVTRQRHYLVLN